MLRRATAEDRQWFLRLRNDPVTVQHSQRDSEVAVAEHALWFERALATPHRQLYVAEVAGVPVGTGRLDCDRQSAELSLVVAPEHRGRGHGEALVAALVAAASAQGIRYCFAYVKPTNVASLQCFAANGFAGAPVRLARTL